MENQVLGKNSFNFSKKIEMTNNFYQKREEEKKKRMENEIESFQKLRHTIAEETEYNMTTEHNTVDANFNTTQYKNIQEDYELEKKKHEDKLSNKIKENSEALANMILELSCSE